MPLHFQINFVRSQGLFPSGVGINHSHRSSSPAAPALGRGNLQVAAVVSHLSQRSVRPRAGASQGFLTFPGADGAASGSPRDSPGPQFWGLEPPFPGGARQKPSPDGCLEPGARASLPPAWDRCPLPAPGSRRKEPR